MNYTLAQVFKWFVLTSGACISAAMAIIAIGAKAQEPRVAAALLAFGVTIVLEMLAVRSFPNLRGSDVALRTITLVAVTIFSVSILYPIYLGSRPGWCRQGVPIQRQATDAFPTHVRTGLRRPLPVRECLADGHCAVLWKHGGAGDTMRCPIRESVDIFHEPGAVVQEVGWYQES